ncbi:MAG: transposase family protein, partial [Ruminococcus sp.]|nr:transposase family protein [Ruminococcus sp.]
MNNQKRIKKLKEKDYQRYFGVNKRTFDKMLEVLEEADRYKHRKGGRPSVLSVLDKLVIMLQYYREYRTMDNIAFDYGTNKSTVYYAIKWAEETLIKNKTFHLPSGKKLLEDTSIEIRLVLIPVSYTHIRAH